MRASNCAAALAAVSLLVGGGSTSATPAQSHEAIDPKARETFSYAVAKDRNLQATVGHVALAGDKAFLPKDKNWIQVEVTITNLSSRIIHITDVKTKLSDGTVVAGANSVTELAKPPSVGATMGKAVGIGTAGMVAGSLIFPPLAILGGIGVLFSNSRGVGSWKRRMERINATALKPQHVAPGTSANGLVFLPAIKGQTALIVFYAIDGRPESLTIPRGER